MNFNASTTRNQRIQNDANLLSAATSALWISALAVGLIGRLLPYPVAPPIVHPPPPIQAQMIHVDLTQRIAPAMAIQSPASPQASPPESAPAAPTAVALPSPSIAFAVPVAGPVRIVPARQASVSPITHPAVQSSSQTSSAPAGPTHLILGQGEGRQPPPQYPFDAIRQGEEGTVVVRFTVDETGAVVKADAVSPTPFPLLNAAALQAVRNTWHFMPGNKRSYEVSIQFQLQRR